MTVGAGPGPAAATAPRRREARSRRARRRRTASRRDRLEYVVLRVVTGLLGALPLWLSFRIGEAVALLVYWLAASLRRVGLIHLAVAFPDQPLPQRHPRPR